MLRLMFGIDADFEEPWQGLNLMQAMLKQKVENYCASP